jgi:hypothetical protein
MASLSSYFNEKRQHGAQMIFLGIHEASELDSFLIRLRGVASRT